MRDAERGAGMFGIHSGVRRRYAIGVVLAATARTCCGVSCSLNISGATMTESGRCRNRRCVPSSDRGLAVHLLAALASLAFLTAWPSSILGQVVQNNRMVNLRGGFRVMTRIGPKGPIGQATFNNVTVVFQQVTVAADTTTEDDLFEDEQPRGEAQINIARGTADDLAFGQGSTAATTQSQLEARLKQEVETIDKICKLTDVQKRKVELAGRGDIKRLMDQAEMLKAEFEKCKTIQTVDEFENWAKAVGEEGGRLGMMMTLRASRDGTLLAKTLKSALTPRQAAEFDRRLANPVDRGAPGHFPGNGFF
jgi:hypothetical protein